MTPSKHTWRFFRAGGSDQVALETADDLRHLRQLDPTLWVALACPVKGLEFDERTLAMMDTDNDGRIRIPEVLAAVEWACAQLTDPAVLFRGGDLALTSISDATDEGKRLRASAQEILRSLGKDEATHISVADTMEKAKVFAQSRYNGDGVVSLEIITDADAKAVAESVIATMGAATDRSGRAGVSQATLDAFVAECEAYVAWYDRSAVEAASLLPLGEATVPAFAALQAVRAKIDDYFARCRVAAFDARATGALNLDEAAYTAVAAKSLTASAADVASFPLAKVEAGRALPLGAGLNPAWSAAMAAFVAQVVQPVIGARETLSEAEWATLTSRFAAYAAWEADKHGGKVESLGIARVREILASNARATLNAMIAEDAAVAPAMNAIDNVERLARYHRDLLGLLNNFVAFRDFYGRERPAVFQVGTLYLDGRRADLCVRVDDAGKHAALAGLAKCYLAYCDCTRPSGEKLTIAAAFTGGDSDNLMVGRNGVFYDRKGRDWDATITKIVENPISIQQAFWAPYKKLVRLIEEQVAKRAAAGQAASDAKVAAAATTTATLDQQKAPAEPPKKIDVGTVAALGVAVGAIGAFVTTLIGYLTGVFKLPFWQVCLVFAGIMLAISLPSMAIAWLKLRQRNLGPILDANGWAVNGRVKMNVPFGAKLTRVGHVPLDAQSSFAVKYPEPPTALPKLIATLVGIAFVLSLLNHYGIIHRLSGGAVGKPTAVRATTSL
ncbi:hypothetical protein Strain138_001620 [Pseudogemmatithrix spongiicola]|uniref:EF-hand domain-containing protein n=1 Tax=Pseudogemmatithrix spongiicola TaxID=3062599 RepID=A0AA49JUR3_9BACT|nr:hypothetical protein Strain138_001620 [Gemmatimonadaceae bacterium 'strain 138']WKW15243.1 hypothetical protein Strain318_001619 [Gemmatimonadaceae bacterium 'strain 318']